jgi:hypothetical protein
VTGRPGEPERRYKHEHSGALLHVHVKKFGNSHEGGGWRFVGRAQGLKNRAATAGKAKSIHRNPKMGHAFVPHRHRWPLPGRGPQLGMLAPQGRLKGV